MTMQNKEIDILVELLKKADENAADYCPVPDTEYVCQWEDRSENDGK